MENEQLDIVEEIEVNMDPAAQEEIIELPMASADEFDTNLAEYMDEDALEEIGDQRVETLNTLKDARQEQDAFLVEHIKLLGIGPRENTSPIPGGCDALHPILMESIVKFQAKAIQELWPAKGPVRTEVVGLVNEQRLQAAARVKAHMNYQLTREVAGAYSDRERGLFRLAALGTNIMKVGWSEQRSTLDPVIVPMEKFFVDPAITHLRYADEYVEIAEYSVRRMNEMVGRKYFRSMEDAEESLQTSEIEEALNKAQGIDQPGIRLGYTVGEAHCYLDLDGADPLVPAGESAPYIVHFNTSSGKVYSIRRNWAAEDAMRNRLSWYVAESMIPGFGFYGYGYIHLIGDIAKGATTSLRALVDAGMFSNFQGGFKSKMAKFSQSDTPIEFGEWRDVDASPEDLQRSFFPLPFKEPSQVLFQLLQFMVGAGQKFADSTDAVVSEATNYGPVATTLALLEASQRFYSSIHKRLHKSQEEFFTLLGRVNHSNLPDRVNFVVGSENQFVMRADYNPAEVAVIPASDPNALTETQRVAKAQIVLESAQRFPQHVDARMALRNFYMAMGVDNIDQLMPNPEEQAISADPLTELQVAMKGKPIRAQMGQNHAAHVIVKEAFLKTPQMQGTNDPSVAVGMEIVKSNIAEHKVLMFIAQVMAQAQQAGVNPQDEMVQAQIAQQLMMMSAESGMPSGGDPTEQVMLQLQAQELQIADKRIESQNARDVAALAIKARELSLKEQQFMMDAAEKLERRKLDAAAKILDNNAKMADIETKRLSAFAQRQNRE
jgi:hypothetical protein